MGNSGGKELPPARERKGRKKGREKKPQETGPPQHPKKKRHHQQQQQPTEVTVSDELKHAFGHMRVHLCWVVDHTTGDSKDPTKQRVLLVTHEMYVVVAELTGSVVLKVPLQAVETLVVQKPARVLMVTHRDYPDVLVTMLPDDARNTPEKPSAPLLLRCLNTVRALEHDPLQQLVCKVATGDLEELAQLDAGGCSRTDTDSSLATVVGSESSLVYLSSLDGVSLTRADGKFVVSSIAAGSAAAEAGLRRRAVLVSVQSTPVVSHQQLIDISQRVQGPRAFKLLNPVDAPRGGGKHKVHVMSPKPGKELPQQRPVPVLLIKGVDELSSLGSSTKSGKMCIGEGEDSGNEDGEDEAGDEEDDDDEVVKQVEEEDGEMEETVQDDEPSSRRWDNTPPPPASVSSQFTCSTPLTSGQGLLPSFRVTRVSFRSHPPVPRVVVPAALCPSSPDFEHQLAIALRQARHEACAA